MPQCCSTEAGREPWQVATELYVDCLTACLLLPLALLQHVEVVCVLAAYAWLPSF